MGPRISLSFYSLLSESLDTSLPCPQYNSFVISQIQTGLLAFIIGWAVKIRRGLFFGKKNVRNLGLYFIPFFED